jgi:hypothetical protein
MPAPVLAHLGHELVTFAFYVPTIAFILWLGITQFRQRRGARGDGAGSSLDG